MSFQSSFFAVIRVIFVLIVSIVHGNAVADTQATALTFIDGLQIQTRDGIFLSANAYLPSRIQENKKLPLIVMPNSWDLDEYEYKAPAQELARRGYIVLSYSARGWGKSQGLVNGGGTLDVNDIQSIIDWSINHLPVDYQRIGMAGISYGGGLSLLAAAKDARIRAVAAMSAWSDLEYALFANDTPSIIWGGLLVNTGKILGHLDPEIEKHYRDLLKHQNINQAKAWTKDRSPINLVEAINQHHPAIYLSHNLEDRLFKTNMMIDFYNRLSGAKKMDLNQGIHGTAEAPGLLGFKNYPWSQTYAWFDQWLQDKPETPMLGTPVSVELKGGKRIHLSTLSLHPLSQAYYLQERTLLHDGRLRDTVGAASSNTLSFGHFTGVNSGVPILSPLLEPYKATPIISWLPGINPLSAIYYESKPLKENKTILGAPRVHLWYKSSSAKSQFIAYLYDVDALGFGRLIGHAPISHYHDNTTTYQLAEFDLSFSAYEMAKGHRLALAIGMYDVLYQSPKQSPYQIKLAYGPVMASRLEVPFTA